MEAGAVEVCCFGARGADSELIQSLVVERYLIAAEGSSQPGKTRAPQVVRGISFSDTDWSGVHGDVKKPAPECPGEGQTCDYLTQFGIRTGRAHYI